MPHFEEHSRVKLLIFAVFCRWCQLLSSVLWATICWYFLLECTSNALVAIRLFFDTDGIIGFLLDLNFLQKLCTFIGVSTGKSSIFPGWCKFAISRSIGLYGALGIGFSRLNGDALLLTALLGKTILFRSNQPVYQKADGHDDANQDATAHQNNQQSEQILA